MSFTPNPRRPAVIATDNGPSFIPVGRKPVPLRPALGRPGPPGPPGPPGEPGILGITYNADTGWPARPGDQVIAWIDPTGQAPEPPDAHPADLYFPAS